jgi:hypothetical protein
MGYGIRYVPPSLPTNSVEPSHDDVFTGNIAR